MNFNGQTNESEPRELGGRDLPSIGILGFGRVGTVLARLAHQAGYRVTAAASGDPDAIAMIRDVLAPGVALGWPQHVAETADILILALPLHAQRELSADSLSGKIVVDATNHWRDVDGPREDWVPPGATTSEFLQRLLPGARLIKAFNHVGYRDLAPGIAIALVGDDREAAETVASLIGAMGFQAVDLGPLSQGRLLEPGAAAFGAALPEGELRRLIETSSASAWVAR